MNENSRAEPQITFDGNFDIDLLKEKEFFIKLGDASLQSKRLCSLFRDSCWDPMAKILVVCEPGYRLDDKWIEKLKKLKGWG